MSKALKKAGFTLVGQKGSHIRVKRKAIEGVDRTRMTIVPLPSHTRKSPNDSEVKS